MKKQIIIVSIACALSVPATAQLNRDSISSTTAVASKTDAGLLLATLAGAINADSYAPGYAREKQIFIKRAKSATTGKAVAGNIAELINYIKPEKFSKDIKIDDLLSATRSTTTLKESAGLLKRFEMALKPEAISAMWSLSRTSWLNDVKQLTGK